MLALLAVPVLMLVTAPAAQAETKLRWKFSPGEKIGYEMKMEMDQDMTVGDMKIGMKMEQLMNISWEIKEVADDGTATLTQTLDHVRMNVTPAADTGQQPIEYDSSKEKQDPAAAMLAPVFDAMVGQPITMKMTPLGEIKDMEFPAAMLAAMQKSPLPGMGDMFSEEGMKQMIGRGMHSFPKDAVSKGQTWEMTDTIVNPILGKQTTEMRYEYAGQEERAGRKLDAVDLDMTMKFEPPPDAKLRIDVKEQSSDGALYFDNAAGRLAESNLTSKMSLEMEADGMNFLQDITTKVTMTQRKP